MKNQSYFITVYVALVRIQTYIILFILMNNNHHSEELMQLHLQQTEKCNEANGKDESVSMDTLLKAV